MIATLLLLLFMFFVPKKFKTIGIKMIINNEKQGIFLFLLSKLSWWFSFYQVANIWLSEYMDFILFFIILGVAFRGYKDRKYLVFNFKKSQSI